MAREFSVGQHTYRVGSRLSVFDANHVARKYGGVLIFLGTMVTDDQNKPTPEQYARAMVATSSPLDAKDIDFAVRSCVATVQRKQATAWAPVMSADGQLMFQDIELLELMVIVWNVLDENGLLRFFLDAPSASSPAQGQDQQ